MTKSVAEELRIRADEIKARFQAGEPITFLDVRNDKAWGGSANKMPGAIRIRMADWRIDPSWPKDRLTVAY
jgi:hypothetical protein